MTAVFGPMQLAFLALVAYLVYKTMKKELSVIDAALIILGIFLLINFPKFLIALVIIAIVVMLFKKSIAKFTSGQR